MSRPVIVLEVPDLGSDRFRLRAWQQPDAPALVRAWCDPAILAGSSPPVDRSLAAASRWISGCDARRRTGVALDLVVAGPGDTVWGEIGLADLDVERRSAAIGWWVAADRRGAGIATEAVSLVTHWALAPHRLRTLVAEIDPENRASMLVAERAGYAPGPVAPASVPGNPQGPQRRSGARVCYVANSTVKRVP